jgi:hypothetical protein
VLIAAQAFLAVGAAAMLPVTLALIRSMAFTDGLDRWELRGTFLRQGTGFDYSAATEDGRAILAAPSPSRPDPPSSPRTSTPATTAV